MRLTEEGGFMPPSLFNSAGRILIFEADCRCRGASVKVVYEVLDIMNIEYAVAEGVALSISPAWEQLPPISNVRYRI